MMERSLPLDAEHLQLYRDAGFARRMAAGLVGEGAVEDVWQEAWRAVLERPPRSDWDLRGHVWTIVRRVALRRRHGEGRRRARERAAARAERLPSSAELVERMEVHRGVVAALLALDEPYRRTILLLFFEDLDPAEIARRDGIPLETVRSRRKRALALLRERLQREHGNEPDWMRGLLALAGGGARDVAPALPWVPTVVAAGGLLAIGALAWLRWPARDERPLALAVPGAEAESQEARRPAGASHGARSERVPATETNGTLAERGDSTLGGIVTDRAGRGIARAEVTAHLTGLFSVELLATVRADGAGRYALPWPARSALEIRGRYLTLEGWASGYRCVRLELPLAEIQGSRAPDMVLDAGRSLAGCVVDEGGRPVPKVFVLARGRERGEARTLEPSTTDSRGRFLLGSSEGFEPERIEAWRPDVGWGELARLPRQSAPDLLLRAGDVVLHELVVLRGEARYPDGAPARELGIGATLVGRKERGESAAETRAGLVHTNGFTDEHGRFALTGLCPGPFAVGALRDGSAREGVVWPEQGEARLTLVHRRILAEVSDGAGRALEDVWVVCTPLARDVAAGWRPAGLSARTLTRGPGGRASFTGMPAGPMALTVLLPGWAGELVVVPEQGSWETVQPFALAAEEPRGAVRLVTGAGEPLAGLTVRLTTSVGRVPLDRTWSSDRDGLVAGLPAGRFRAEFHAARGAEDPWRLAPACILEVAPGAVLDMPLALERGGRLDVTFQAGEAAPFSSRERAPSGPTWSNLETWASWQSPRARALLVREGSPGEPIELAGARPGGRWNGAQPLRPARYRLETAFDGFEPTRQWVVVEAERTHECDVWLTRRTEERRSFPGDR
jgi:RNA polymerase sigma-70 factor (ECF subfamily)